MKIEVLSRAKKKKFVEGLGDIGVSKVNQMLVRSGKEKVRAFSGDLDKSEILDLWRVLPIEGIGLYVGKDMVNRNGVREVRATIDGLHVWRDQVKGRVLDLDGEQENKWFLGEDVALDEAQVSGIGDQESGKVEGFVAVRGGEDFIGVGKIGIRNQESGIRTLFNFLPKERRRKERAS